MILFVVVAVRSFRDEPVVASTPIHVRLSVGRAPFDGSHQVFEGGDVARSEHASSSIAVRSRRRCGFFAPAASSASMRLIISLGCIVRSSLSVSKPSSRKQPSYRT